MWFLITLQYLLLLVFTEGVNGDVHPNLGLLPEECGYIDGERKPESKYARLYEFPWMTRISRFRSDGGRQFVCSGTVINKRYILTTAHCAIFLNDIPESPTSQVRVGDYDVQHDVDCEGQGPTLLCEDQYQEIEIEHVIVHYNFTASRYVPENDIALLRLTAPIDFSHKNAGPVCLPITAALQNNSLAGKEAIIAGWEYMKTGGTTTKMLKLNVPTRKYEECLSNFNSTRLNSKKMLPSICTGGVEGVCSLESGSALMLPSAVKKDEYRYVQYGILYSGSKKCDSEQWTLYTDISKHVKWILDNLKE